jgi:glycerophosphoryl diester phosphodiesterase
MLKPSRHGILLGILSSCLLAGCHSPPPAAQNSDAGLPADASVVVDPPGPWNDPPPPLPPDGGSYRDSLSHCWNDATCQRAMLVSHGGDWNLNMPYDSRGALVTAVQLGSDGIKADLRMTADHVAVVAHSSPIEVYESIDCQGQKIEDMTAAQVTSCHMFGTGWTFCRVDDLLQWAHGRTVVMLDVKVSTDLPAAIQTGIANNAQDDLFLEVGVTDFENIVVGAPGWEQMHYLVSLDSPADATLLISQNHAQQAFMYEMDPTYPDYDATAMQQFITGTLHPAGIRAFTSTDTVNPTTENHQMLFGEGFDVVMTYDLSVGLPVRQAINTARGISPP